MISKETLFALSLFPYLGFLWFISRSPQMPRIALYGFYGTLVFVGITIPAGIYAKVQYGEALANIDWLHGGAEVFLTLANILVVIGFRQAVKELKSKGAGGQGWKGEGEKYWLQTFSSYVLTTDSTPLYPHTLTPIPYSPLPIF